MSPVVWYWQASWFELEVILASRRNSTQGIGGRYARVLKEDKICQQTRNELLMLAMAMPHE